MMILMAQSVPSATSVPCVASLPAGWKLGGVQIARTTGRVLARLRPRRDRAVEVTLLPPERLPVDDATEVPSDEVGMRRFERPEQLPPELRSTRVLPLPGGCVTYEFAFDGDADRVADLRRRQRARVPAPRRTGRRGARRSRSGAVRRRSAAVRGRIVRADR